MDEKTFCCRVFGIVMVYGLCFAASPAIAEGIKIGYVNAVKVLEQAPQGEVALKKLQAEFGPRDKKLVSMQENIKKMEEELEKNALIMKEPERRTQERELLVLKRDLRRATQEFREDWNMRRNEELASLRKIIKKAIIELAKQEKYDLIVHEGTIYASSAIDITDKVLKKLTTQSENK